MICDIAALRRKVIARYPFFGSIAANIDCQETEDVETIEHDSEHILYNPRYLAGLSDSNRVFLLTRELCHIAFRHTERGGGKDPVIWERAAEAVINQMLKRDGLDIPTGDIDYPEAIDYDVEQYYEVLLREKLAIDLINGQLEGRENPEGGEGEGVPMPGDEDSEDDNSDEAAQEQLLEGDVGDEGEESGEEADGDSDEDSDDEYALVEKKQSKAGNADSRDERIVEEIGNSALSC